MKIRNTYVKEDQEVKLLIFSSVPVRIK